ncbi:LysR family transcriptional regulator [Variovorax paradoxus]|uniref:LysR family transcriptional regulator n=1 Tax=Variovorax paradoxus TaxID=34073 RepID=UPI003ECFEF06
MQTAKATDIRLALASDLTIWRSFLAIAELGSLTRAAIYLDSNQSLLSRQINALERQCGCRLFTRTGRGVELSETGTRILEQVRELLQGAQQLETDIRSNLQQPVGRVTLGLLPSISSALVGRLFSHMREYHPAVQLKILEGSSGQVEEWLTDARVDLAILYRYATLPEHEQKLATVDSYLVGPAGDPLTGGGDIPVSALAGLPYILPSAPNGLRNALDAVARQDKLAVVPVIEADSLPLFKSLAEQEHLYSVLPLHAVWNEIEEGRLQAAKIADARLQRSITMAMSKSKGPARAVQVVAAAICTIVDELGRRGMWHSTAQDIAMA